MAKASLNTAELIGTDAYGMVPKKIYTRFRKLNISPMDFDQLEDVFHHDWDAMLEFAEANSTGGYYREPWPFPQRVNR